MFFVVVIHFKCVCLYVCLCEYVVPGLFAYRFVRSYCFLFFCVLFFKSICFWILKSSVCICFVVVSGVRAFNCLFRCACPVRVRLCHSFVRQV